jgi:hypothetical protein
MDKNFNNNPNNQNNLKYDDSDTLNDVTEHYYKNIKKFKNYNHKVSAE